MQTIERLETRCHLSADLPAEEPQAWVSRNGTLIVIGTEADDTVLTYRDTPDSQPGPVSVIRLSIDGLTWTFPIDEVRRVHVEGGEGDDYYSTLTDLGTRFFGGDGDDHFFGSGAPDLFDGGAGDDHAGYGGGGDDTILGGSGDDSVYMSSFSPSGRQARHFDGSDRIDGGPGRDLISFVGSEGIRLSQDGVANDGARGESDNVTGFEVMVGTQNNDTIHGTDGDDFIDGYGGRDLLIGHGGNDYLRSTDAHETHARLYGGPGNDVIDTRGAKIVEGGTGDDLLIADGLDTFKSVAFANAGGYDMLQLLDEPASRTFTAEDGRGLGAIELDEEHVNWFADDRGLIEEYPYVWR